jgi:hypothetical protein
MFIRKRLRSISRKTSTYQIIETFRQNGRVRQRVLLNLGKFPTPEAALTYRQERMEDSSEDPFTEDYIAALASFCSVKEGQKAAASRRA